MIVTLQLRNSEIVIDTRAVAAVSFPSKEFPAFQPGVLFTSGKELPIPQAAAAELVAAMHQEDEQQRTRGAR